MDGQTDRLTDGIAVASTALAMRALRRAVKNSVGLPPPLAKDSAVADEPCDNPCQLKISLTPG